MMTRILPLFLLLLCLGCASPLSGARISYAAARAVYDAAEGRYKAEQEACLASSEPPEPCVAAVRERWRPLRKPADALRSLLIAFAGSLTAYDALSKAGRTSDPSTLTDASRRALKAAEALASALSTMGVP